MALRFVCGLLAGVLLVGGGLYARRLLAWSEEERSVARVMHAFVRALSERPENGDPSPRWTPLTTAPVRCATCHGDSGADMEADIASGELDVSAGERPTHDDMVRLMERWVRRLNRDARHSLRKAVVCLDCHASDPRRR